MVWSMDAEHGMSNVLAQALPAQHTTQCLSQLLTDPEAMTGQHCLSLGVSAAGGVFFPDDAGRRDPARNT